MGLWSKIRRRWARSKHGADLRFKTIELAASPSNVHQALHLLPSVLDTQSLPNGVVELVIEDQRTPGRYVLDIHDGEVSHLEPGTAIPWASIAGPHSAWALALGGGEASGLRLTGEERLAQRVLAALPRPAIVDVARQGATV